MPDRVDTRDISKYEVGEQLAGGYIQKINPSLPWAKSGPGTLILGRQKPPPAAKANSAPKSLGLSGQFLSDGKYALCKNPQRADSGNALIYTAYRTDGKGGVKGPKLAIKVSTECDFLELENKNYDKVTFGLFPGRFVKKIEFLPELDEPSMKNKCGLVIESGERDLRNVLSERRGRGLEGKAMRDAAESVASCIQAMHSSGLVWGDLKTKNFVVVGDSIGEEGSLPGVKGIDLESAQPRGSGPDKYSPDACPPELAEAISGKTEGDFQYEFSYDMFGYGLLLFELATGGGYFKSAFLEAQIRNKIARDDWVADVSAVEDDRLRDLIQKCLDRDPRKRPNIVQVLLHPYFTGFR
eukprot:gnl/TRDRNA2_/TRDRNA2_124529_c1_seq1.p1 gnl/TRDRNA2_/TRDRNA2_124529_c1~~gnl/TRDRNA2_/TRDRNA2_124529_c1_seq1.p1  ORF type:complete len:400 (+),score=51.43 gnl/TRDRNA2_/TRDRNA2_124529_c1_seq1:140-1201(+)